MFVINYCLILSINSIFEIFRQYRNNMLKLMLVFHCQMTVDVVPIPLLIGISNFMGFFKGALLLTEISLDGNIDKYLLQVAPFC